MSKFKINDKCILIPGISFIGDFTDLLEPMNIVTIVNIKYLKTQSNRYTYYIIATKNNARWECQEEELLELTDFAKLLYL